jgi:intein-encoded DNA endonuclease-like protein
MEPPSRMTLVRWAKGTTDPSRILNRFVPVPSKDLSFFLGAWLGDGWADESDGGKRMLLKVRSFDFAKEFAECATRLLNKTSPYWVRRVRDKHGQWYLVKVTSIALYNFVNQPFAHLQEFVRAYPSAFLRGFFTAEGNPAVSISQRRCPWLDVGINLTNSDLELIQACGSLLSGLGFSSIRVRLVQRAGEVTNLGVARKNCWLLTLLRIRDVARFATEIGFADSGKQQKLTEALS